MEGQYVIARQNLEACIAMNATRNSTSFAKYRLALMGLTKEYDSFTVKKSAHFRFHFHPRVLALTDIDTFMQRREAAYDSICKFLGGTLNRTIDFFVWPDPYTSQELLGKELGFSMPAYCIVQSHYRQSVGHELAHVLTGQIFQIRRTTAVVNEGIAVYLDQSGRDRLSIARDAYNRHAGGYISIVGLWDIRRQSNQSFDELTYPVGAAFLEFLEQKRGRALLLELIKHQSLEEARRIYGTDFDKLIAEFEQLLVMK